MRTQFPKRLLALGLLVLASVGAQAQHKLKITLLKPLEDANDFHLVFRNPGISGYSAPPKSFFSDYKVNVGPFGEKVDFYWKNNLDVFDLVGLTITFTVSHQNYLPELISGYWTKHDPTEPYDPDKATNIGVIDMKDVKVTAVPEPATMLVLGAGFVAVLRARRKAA